MVDLKKYRATSGETNFIEQIKAPVFLGSFSNGDNVRAPIQFRKKSTLASTHGKTHPISHQIKLVEFFQH